MKQLFGRTLLNENDVSVTYYILKTGEFYGLEAVQSGGADDKASSVILGITDSLEKIKNFADSMIREKVLPVSLLDVTYDYVEANNLMISRKF